MNQLLTTVLFGGCMALALGLLSCSADSYPGLSYDEPEDFDASNSESSDRIPVLLFTKDPFFVSVSTNTRSTGAYDVEELYTIDDWRNSKFYLYAFRSKAEDNPPLNYNPDYTKKAADDTESGNGNCLIDGSLANSSYNYGLPIYIVNDPPNQVVEGLNVGPNATGDPIYYSTTYQKTGMDFFMYRIDNDYDYNTGIVRSNGKVYYNLEIDGAMDPVYGVAPKLNKNDVANKLGTTVDDPAVGNVLDFGYSTYSAHRGFHPTIPLQHCLTRFKFSAYAGAANADKIQITAIRVMSKYKAKFTVASTNHDELGLAFEEDMKYLSLGQKEGDHIVELEPKTIKYDPSKDNGDAMAWLKQDKVPLGESLLLPPAQTYEMVIEFKEQRTQDNGKVYYHYGSAKYTLTPPSGFEFNYFKESYLFQIQVAVFGSEKIQVFANVQGWQQGGDVEVPEPDFEL